MLEFIKLFVRPKEGENFSPALIAYQKFPQLFNQKVLNNGEVEIVVTQYRYFLYINLYLIILTFYWDGPTKKV